LEIHIGVEPASIAPIGGASITSEGEGALIPCPTAGISALVTATKWMGQESWGDRELGLMVITDPYLNLRHNETALRMRQYLFAFPEGD